MRAPRGRWAGDITVWPRASSSLSGPTRDASSGRRGSAPAPRALIALSHVRRDTTRCTFTTCYPCSRLTLLPIFPVAQSRRSPCLMASDDHCESPQGVVGLPSSWEDLGNVRVERHDEATFCVAGGVLVRPRAAEVVLREDFVDSNPTCSQFLSVWLPHMLFAHGALRSAR